jgi:hypothetical protein
MFKCDRVLAVADRRGEDGFRDAVGDLLILNLDYYYSHR